MVCTSAKAQIMSYSEIVYKLHDDNKDTLAIKVYIFSSQLHALTQAAMVIAYNLILKQLWRLLESNYKTQQTSASA